MFRQDYQDVQTFEKLRLANEVKKWEEEDPDEVNQVPVKAREIDGVEIFGAKIATPSAED